MTPGDTAPTTTMRHWLCKGALEMQKQPKGPKGKGMAEQKEPKGEGMVDQKEPKSKQQKKNTNMMK